MIKEQTLYKFNYLYAYPGVSHRGRTEAVPVSTWVPKTPQNIISLCCMGSSNSADEVLPRGGGNCGVLFVFLRRKKVGSFRGRLSVISVRKYEIKKILYLAKSGVIVALN